MVRVARFEEPVELTPAAYEHIRHCRQFVDKKIAEKAVMYGVNTGVGELSEVVLKPEELARFQRSIVYSHSAGCGKPLPIDVVRAAMVSRVNVLSKGHSGVRPEVVSTIVVMLNKGVTPVVYEKGSVGACGDLAPMSQIALVMIGKGEAFYRGKRMAGKDAMEAAGIPLIRFEARDGLAVINGSNVTAGYGSLELYDADRLFKNSEIALALTLEVLNANMAAFDERLHKARGYRGAIVCAGNIRRLVEGSEMLAQPGKKVQDAYSLRSTPQVIGAAKDAWEWARGMFETELNGVNDNPVFFPNDGAYLAGANFQGTPLGIALDTIGNAITMTSVIAERRTNRLLDPNLSAGLPAFLTKNVGTNSGLMITQYTQAMLVCESRTLSAPSSVGSIPAAGDQEDFVSMSFNAALKTNQILQNAWYVTAIEMIAAAQAVEFRRPLRLGKGTRAAYEAVRRYVANVEEDRPLANDINLLASRLRSGKILESVEKAVGRLSS